MTININIYSPDGRVEQLFDTIEEYLIAVNERTIQLMATVQELNDKLDALASDLAAQFGALSQEIAALKTSGGASPEQLDALGAKVDALDATVKGFSA